MIQFGLFLLQFAFIKIILTLAAATVLLVLSLAVCKIAGPGHWRLSLAAFSMVPLAGLMGYSKIFFSGRVFFFSNRVYQMAGA